MGFDGKFGGRYSMRRWIGPGGFPNWENADSAPMGQSKKNETARKDKHEEIEDVVRADEK